MSPSLFGIASRFYIAYFLSGKILLNENGENPGVPDKLNDGRSEVMLTVTECAGEFLTFHSRWHGCINRAAAHRD